MPKSKVFASFADAVRDIPDGSVIGFGGFAVVGMPINLYQALAEQGARGLTCVSNGTRGGATMPENGPTDRKSTRLNSSHSVTSRMPSSA